MRRCGVIFAFILGVWASTAGLHAQELVQQYGRKEADKGPRAVGLVQISDKGKARIIPICIMMNGKFYDAGSYKAAPVPMALDFGIVYEGFRTGVSQGIFTITQPGQLNHAWIAEGTWYPAGTQPPEKTKKYGPPIIDTEEKEDRPTLHRRAGGEADKDDTKPAAAPATAPSTSAPAASDKSAAPSSQPTPATTVTPAAPSTSGGASGPKDTTPSASKDSTKASAPAITRTSDLDHPINDPNRPVLRRGKPDSNAHHEPFVNFDDQSEAVKAGEDSSKGAGAAPSVQTVAAISDAGGPDPRPYTYDVKPAEEAIYRNKMLELAATLVRPKTQQAAPAKASSPSTAKGSAASQKKPSAAKPAQPPFEDVKLRIFDLSNSNEPVLVVSARTPIPPAGSAGSRLPQEVTLVARTTLEGELQKLFFSQTDSQHLDVTPRLELIDAVDADGDGRGELLFRRTFDAGSAYAIYRVTADQLWPLFEGIP